MKRKTSRLKTSALTRARRYLFMSGDEALEELGAQCGISLDELSERRSRLLPIALTGLAANLCVWGFALAFPHFTASVYGYITGNSFPRYGDLLSVAALAIPFAPPFVSVFAILNLRGPTDLRPASTSDVMASFQYVQTSNRRWLKLMIAAICGALNCVLLLIAMLIRTGN